MIKMKSIIFFLLAMITLSAAKAQVTYTIQTGNFTTNALTVNTNSNYFAGTSNNTSSEVSFYANGSGSGWTGDPGVASFQTFTTNGIGNGTPRPLKVGDQFSITCYVGNSSDFFPTAVPAFPLMIIPLIRISLILVQPNVLVFRLMQMVIGSQQEYQQDKDTQHLAKMLHLQ